MLKGKLVELLKSFSNRERKRFGEYLDSPFFHAGDKHRKLFATLDELMFYLGNQEVSKEQVWERLFPGSPFDDIEFRTCCSQLLKKAEDFLVQVALSNDDVEHKHLLASELDRRRLDKHLNYTLITARKTVDKSPLRNASHYFDRFRIEVAQHQLNARSAFRSQKLAPQQALEALDTYYFANKLRYSCEILNLRKILQIDPEIAMLPELEQYLLSLEESDRDMGAVIRIYRNILSMLQEGDEEAYKSLRRLIEIHGSEFATSELYELYIHAINFCIRRYNRGDTAYRAEILGLYRGALDNGALFDNNGFLSPSSYKNIVTIGLRAEEYKWVRRFIGDYKRKIPASFRENAYTYNLAKYYYALGKFDNVLELLREVEYEDVFYNLDSKTMLLKIYYDREESDALFSLFDSFSVYLRRSKVLSPYHKTINLNLIRFVKKLAGIPEGETAKLDRLQKRIETNREVADINWLLEKIEEKKSLSTRGRNRRVRS